jgi:hypothetical protein
MKWSCKKLCRLYEQCNKPCEVLNLLTGKDKSIKELLPPPDISDITPLDKTSYPPVSVGYKDVMQANIEARNRYLNHTIKDIRQIGDTLQKAVAAMLYADISIIDIAIIIDKSTKTVKRIAKR